MDVRSPLDKLSMNAHSRLYMLSKGPRIYRVGSTTMDYLERSGLALSRQVVSMFPSKEYRITPFGKQALDRADRRNSPDTAPL